MKNKTLFWITVFAVSMGFFESAVVIYLRYIAYPGGFAFPLQPIDKNLVITEMIREAFSLLMLLSVSIFTGKSAVTRFAWFIYAFAVWDIFFYFFLKILTGWPESLMTVDLLFLLPVMWVGPVLAPLILSFVMIFFAFIILYLSAFHESVRFEAREIWSLTIGVTVFIISFTADFSGFVISRFSSGDIRTLTVEKLSELSLQYNPGEFYWLVFLVGIIFMLMGIVLFVKRNISGNDG